jgi:hypothetical protein
MASHVATVVALCCVVVATVDGFNVKSRVLVDGEPTVVQRDCKVVRLQDELQGIGEYIWCIGACAAPLSGHHCPGGINALSHGRELLPCVLYRVATSVYLDAGGSMGVGMGVGGCGCALCVGG